MYINNLKKYDSWNPNKRLLVYYEDLIEEPEETFKKILSFFGKDTSLVEILMKDFENFKVEILKKYIKSQGYSATRGNDIYFHSKKFRPFEIYNMDKAISSRHPKLWEKYLKRYGENPFLNISN